MNKKIAIQIGRAAILILLPLIGLISIRAHAADSAAEEPTVVLSIKNHKFSVETIKVKANQVFKVKVTNEDATSEEFESKTMIIEKFISPKRTLTISIGPLKPGTYEYFGDFHKDTAKGVLTAE